MFAVPDTLARMSWLKYPGAIAVMIGIALAVDNAVNAQWSIALFGVVLGLAGVGCLSLSNRTR